MNRRQLKITIEELQTSFINLDTKYQLQTGWNRRLIESSDKEKTMKEIRREMENAAPAVIPLHID